MNTCDDLVTVLMSVYKTDVNLLDRAVNSILNQTYRDFEFLIVDDGADPDCVDYLERIADPRVILIHNDSNIGLAASLNKGIDIARGKYIARMDADDYSYPNRLYEQVSYMNQHSDIDVLACISMDIKDGKMTGGIGGAYARFDNEDMRIELSLAPKVFPHPTVMFRTDFLNDNNLRYDKSFIRSQDYDMWARCSMYGKLDSLQKVLLLYNSNDEKGKGLSDKQILYSNLTKLKCLERLLPNPTEKEKDLYIHMRDTGITGTVQDNLALVDKLISINNNKDVYHPRKYRHILYFWWGRKMLYSENRRYLSEFLRRPVFILRVLSAFAERVPGYVHQRLYTKMIVRKTMKNE